MAATSSGIRWTKKCGILIWIEKRNLFNSKTFASELSKLSKH